MWTKKESVFFSTIIIISLILFRSHPQKTVIPVNLNGQQQTVKPIKPRLKWFCP